MLVLVGQANQPVPGGSVFVDTVVLHKVVPSEITFSSSKNIYFLIKEDYLI